MSLLSKMTYSVVGLALVFAVPVSAEVSSQACPYDCGTQNIPRSMCKDWRENGKCYIDDLRVKPAASKADSANREVLTVNKVVKPGEAVYVDMSTTNHITRIDVVARRHQGGNQTRLKLGLKNVPSFDGEQQVDKNENHVVQFQTGVRDPKHKKLILNAINGEVFVESVHVIQ